MSVLVRVPTPLRKFTGGADPVAADGATVRALLDDLERRHPGMKQHICDEKGRIRRSVNVCINEDDVRFLEGLDSPLKEQDQVSILPAVAGGCGEHP